MNKIAISLALVAVCVGIVAASKQSSNNQHSEEHEGNFGHHQHHSSKNFELSNCEEECNYVCRHRFYPRHGHENGFGHGFGHGQRRRHGKGSGQNRHEGGKGRNQHGKQVDFFPDQHHFEGPFHSNRGDDGFHSSFDFPGDEFVEHGHPHRFRKQNGKRGSSRKGGNDSGSKGGSKKGDFDSVEAQGGKFAEGGLERSKFDLTHENDDQSQTTDKRKFLNKDLTFIRDKSSEVDDTTQSTNGHHQSDGVHGSEEHAHGFASN